jgi:hypothetical protein
MNKPNTSFELTVQDIELIESSLNQRILELTRQNKDNEISKVTSLLGKLHNQKNWYRPNDTYISG